MAHEPEKSSASLRERHSTMVFAKRSIGISRTESKLRLARS